MLNARVRAGARRALRAAAAGRETPMDANGALRLFDPTAGEPPRRAAGHRHAGLGRADAAARPRRRAATSRGGAPRRACSPTACARARRRPARRRHRRARARDGALRLLEEALEEQGLPTYVVGGRGYWSQEQVRDGLAWLRVLANPLDEEALLDVLASPFCGARHATRWSCSRGTRAAASAALRGGAAGDATLPTARRADRERVATLAAGCRRARARRARCRSRCCSSARSSPPATTSPCSPGPAATGGWRTCAS